MWNKQDQMRFMVKRGLKLNLKGIGDFWCQERPPRAVLHFTTQLSFIISIFSHLCASSLPAKLHSGTALFFRERNRGPTRDPSHWFSKAQDLNCITWDWVAWVNLVFSQQKNVTDFNIPWNCSFSRSLGFETNKRRWTTGFTLSCKIGLKYIWG